MIPALGMVILSHNPITGNGQVPGWSCILSVDTGPAGSGRGQWAVGRGGCTEGERRFIQYRKRTIHITVGSGRPPPESRLPSQNWLNLVAICFTIRMFS